MVDSKHLCFIDHNYNQIILNVLGNTQPGWNTAKGNNPNTREEIAINLIKMHENSTHYVVLRYNFFIFYSSHQKCLMVKLVHLPICSHISTLHCLMWRTTRSPCAALSKTSRWRTTWEAGGVAHQALIKQTTSKLLEE